MIIAIPHTVLQTEAKLWIGAFQTSSAPPDTTVEIQPAIGPIPLLQANWKKVTANNTLPPEEQNILYQIITTPNLSPDTRYSVQLPNDKPIFFRTLPDTVPFEGQPPFTVLLSSCFYYPTDKSGHLGQALAWAKPSNLHMKVLCGDQVYLDQPPEKNFPNNDADLATLLKQIYSNSWTQPENGKSEYRNFLQSSGTFFTADDHEFWNNAPNSATIIQNSWTKAGRDRWYKIALGLYREFQSDEPETAGRPRTFRVNPLSFFIADTRIFREEGDNRFMRDDDLAALDSFVQHLTGPGVIVIGQPVFSKPASLLGRKFFDRSLANYKQYHQLTDVLFQSKHSIITLTGDVHFGRVALCELRQGPRPVKLVEIISSPTALVPNPFVRRKAHNAPDLFPARESKQNARPSAAVKTTYTTAKDHFTMLHFTQSAGEIHLRIQYWFREPDKKGLFTNESAGPEHFPIEPSV